MRITLPTEADTALLGQALAQGLKAPAWIYLEGDLGAGKTYLTRAFLNAKGYQGLVKSPTYTLVERYALSECVVYHFDLYRLESALALEEIGIRDYEGNDVLAFVEWPEKAQGMLCEPTLIIQLETVAAGRVATLKGSDEILQKIKEYAFLLS